MWNGILTKSCIKCYDNTLSESEIEQVINKACNECIDDGFEYESECIDYIMERFGSFRNYLNNIENEDY